METWGGIVLSQELGDLERQSAAVLRNPATVHRDGFLSHASADADLARDLANDLERAGGGRAVSVWLDEGEIQPGGSVPGHVNWGLEHSRFVLILMTPAYFTSESGWADAEWHAALHLDPDNRDGRIVPILAGNCPYIPALLRHLGRIDIRGDRYERGGGELLAVLRGERVPRPTTFRGQLIHAGGLIDRTTLYAERSAPEADPDPVVEKLYCNLLPFEHVPARVYTAPIAEELRGTRADGTEVLPSKQEVKDAITAALAARDTKPFMPAFRLDGDRVVTFHDLSDAEGPFATVIRTDDVQREATSAMLADEDDRRLVVSLLNMAISRHARRRGIVADEEKLDRFYFPPRDGRKNVVTWKPFRSTAHRSVAKPVERDGRVLFWVHLGAYLSVVFLANKLYLKVTPTWVLTEDGQRVKTGPGVGRLVIRWTGAERNVHLLYHLRFWTVVLRDGAGPISIRAGDQRFDVSTIPAFIEQPFGIAQDHADLLRNLDEEAPLISEREEQIASLAAAIEADDDDDGDAEDEPGNADEEDS